MKLNKIKVALKKANELREYINKYNIDNLMSENNIDIDTVLHFDIIKTLEENKKYLETSIRVSKYL